MAFPISNLDNRAQTKGNVTLPNPVILAALLIVRNLSLDCSKSKGTPVTVWHIWRLSICLVRRDSLHRLSKNQEVIEI